MSRSEAKKLRDCIVKQHPQPSDPILKERKGESTEDKIAKYTEWLVQHEIHRKAQEKQQKEQLHKMREKTIKINGIIYPWKANWQRRINIETQAADDILEMWIKSKWLHFLIHRENNWHLIAGQESFATGLLTLLNANTRPNSRGDWPSNKLYPVPKHVITSILKKLCLPKLPGITLCTFLVEICNCPISIVYVIMEYFVFPWVSCFRLGKTRKIWAHFYR
jgi:antibiotic biosynthesis monooxygenase (ABM) superfamily enzyme